MKNSIIEVVQTKIYSIRNSMVMLDYDLAELYGVETKHINQAVRNNPGKFPSDFYFELDEAEFEGLRSKILTTKLSKRRTRPKAFTEQGVYMLATILKSSIATKVTVAIMRAFVKMRHFTLTYEDIVKKLSSVENKVEKHDNALRTVLKALSQLMDDTKNKETKRIGFIVDDK